MPHLILVETASGRSYRVDDTDVLAGRDPACGIFLEGDQAKTVSGRHARFFLDDAGWCVEDAGSRNGTYIGMRKLEPGARHQLAVGDVVGLGLTGTHLSVQAAVGRTLAATMLEPTPSLHPPAARQPRLVLRNTRSGELAAGAGDSITIGRALDCVIRVSGESTTSVSRVHAEVSIRAEGTTIRDNASRHGTFVNDRRIDGPETLRIGDEIRLGPGGPTFRIEDISLSASASPSGERFAVASTSAAQPDPEMANLPTPALGEKAFVPRAGARAPEATPARRRSGSSKARGMRRVKIAGVCGALLSAAAAIAIFMTRSNDGVAGSTSVVQQSSSAESLTAHAGRQLALARQALDSATRIGAPREALDSLRLATFTAEERARTLADSLQRTR